MKKLRTLDPMLCKTTALTFLLMLITLKALAQDPGPAVVVRNPPVNVEGLAGSRGIYYQAIVIKKFQSIPKLGIFSVASMAPEWERGSFDDMMYQGKLTHRIVKGLDVAAGAMYTPVTRFRPSASLIYATGSPAYTIVLAPRIDISKNAATELMVLTEYKPSLTEKWRVYTRVQALYCLLAHSGDHARSYLFVRAGLKYKEFAFGLGGNFDWYGPEKQFRNNMGGFLNVELF